MTDNNGTNAVNNKNRRIRYTRQSIVTNTFLQMPRFLMAGEFAGNGISNNARFLYTLLLDRHRVSVKNGWFDENNEVYIYFKREEMEAQLGVSERTVSKVMQELKDLALVEEKKQGLNKPNKIYLLSPVVDDNENPAPYVGTDPDYNPDYNPEDAYENWHSESYDTEPEIIASPDTQNLHHQTRNIYASEPVNSTVQDPQNLSPNDNKLINNKKSDNNHSHNEGSDTTATAAGGGEIPYMQILEMYNQLCKTSGLRPIRDITGKRKGD